MILENLGKQFRIVPISLSISISKKVAKILMDFCLKETSLSDTRQKRVMKYMNIKIYM